jgi:predicted nuclease of predicted toxin-antitoxin system
MHGAKDPNVLKAATAENRIPVTMNQDFANVLSFSPEETAGIAVISPTGE